MRELFAGYFRPTHAEFASLWRDALFVPDANVLLDPYRTTEETAISLIETFESLAERVRIPHQFALEFSRNRLSTILAHAHECSSAANTIAGLVANLRNARRQPFLDEASIDGLESVRNLLLKEQENHRALLDEDPKLDRILKVASGRIGPAPTDAERIQWSKEAEERYSNQVPPGFKDSKKKNGNSFGDYFAWKQMISLAVTEGKSVIFISNDSKEDWWFEQHGETVCPHPALVEEFQRETRHRFYIYSVDRFMDRAATLTKKPLEARVVRELADIREDRLQRPTSVLSLDVGAFGSSLVPPSIAASVSIALKKKHVPRFDEDTSEPKASTSDPASDLDEDE